MTGEELDFDVVDWALCSNGCMAVCSLGEEKCCHLAGVLYYLSRDLCAVTMIVS